MQQSLFDTMSGKASPETEWRQTDFRAFVQGARLSAQAKHVLLTRIATLEEFLLLQSEEVIEFKNLSDCEHITALELLKFQKALQRTFKIRPPQAADKFVPEGDRLNVDRIVDEAQTTLSGHLSPPEEISRYDYLLDEITALLSERARKVLEAHSVDSLERFMALSISTMESMKNCGQKCIVEYTSYQKHIRQLLQKIHDYQPAEHRVVQNGDELSPALVYQLFDDILMDGFEHIDLENPFPSLQRWLASIYSDAEKGQTAFMLRMGMLGALPMTLEDVGQQLEGLSRERIRQIIEKAELGAKHRFHQKRLGSLLQKIADVVTSQGRRVSKDTLISLVLVRGEGGEHLQHATGFIDFLSTLAIWDDIGLRIDEDDVVISS